MKTLNLALITALTLTTTSALAGTNLSHGNSSTVNHSTTAFTNKSVTNRQGSGTSFSRQEYDTNNFNQEVTVFDVDSHDSSLTEGVALSSYVKLGASMSSGNVSRSNGNVSGGSQTVSFTSGYGRNLTSGTYLKSSMVSDGVDNHSTYSENGTFSTLDKSSYNKNSVDIGVYSTSYSNTDVNYNQ